MSLYEIFQPPMPQYSNNINPFCMDDYSFSQFPSTINNSPDISSSIPYLETIFSDHEYMEFPVYYDESYVDTFLHDFQMDVDEFDDHDHAMIVSCEKSMHPSLILPFEGMEVGRELCLDHLLRAYAEAMDNQEPELVEVIAQRIILKVSPLGLTNDRLLYYMFQHQNRESDHMYLEQESIKNFYPAFKAFYQMFPYGKFAHFVANFAILEALPTDADIIHLFDFDIGEGVQWVSFMEAIKHRNKEIRLTSIKFSEDDETSPFRWRFEDTKRRLRDHAKSYGLMIKIEEVGLQDLENMILDIKRKDYRKKSWYVFNTHVGLPHMGRNRSRKNVLEFLRLAKEFLHQVTCWGTSYNKGMITYGSVDALHYNNIINSSLSTYSSFLDGNFAYYRALLESMESNFPSHLEEARIALECLFVVPNVSIVAKGWRWEERRQNDEFELGVEMEGLELSEANLGEAKEVVSEGVSLYRVRIEGERNNEMVMEWNGVPMVRVCCWKC